MESFATIGTVLLLFFLGMVIPGPNFIVVTRQSMRNGYKNGIYSALGVAFGDLIYASLGMMSLVTLLSTSLWIISWIKLLGGIYLIYLGYKLFKSKRKDFNEGSMKRSVSPLNAFRLGLLTDLSNPKTIVFFAGIFSTSIHPNQSLESFMLIVLLIFCLSILWRILICYIFSRPAFRSFYHRLQSPLESFFAIILILFGIKLTVSEFHIFKA